MRRAALGVSAILLALSVAPVARAHEDGKNLPAGPIHDRHELMEGIGKNAKIIGDALKSGDFKPVEEAAQKIHAAAPKALPLFPKGSTHEKSRAKPEIWQNWAEFENLMKKLETDSGALAAAAKSGADVPGAAKAMFGNCKSCHEQFRIPEKN